MTWQIRLSLLIPRRELFVLLISALTAIFASSPEVRAGLLLDDKWTDGNRTSTSLPTDSPTWIGQSSGNGSNSVSPGSLDFVLPTNSLKVWEYFTSDNSAPDTNQPHNAVTQLGVGDQLLAWTTFTPTGVTAASTSKNFRVGLFFDPTDGRVESDTNSDAGGGTSPWADAVGYGVQIPLNSSSSNSNPLSIGKRTSSANTSLLGSNNSYTLAPTGGSAYSITSGNSYKLQLTLNVVSASQLDVTATLLQGTTVLATQTVSDLGSTFGGTAITPTSPLPGSSSIYTKFDQLFFRESDNTQSTGLSFTNWHVEVISIPEPGSIALLSLGGLALLLRRRNW
jgi:hypothetical protein